MIQIDALKFRYKSSSPCVLDDFSLSLTGGSVVGLFGRNGTGKSTLLYLMSGLLRAQQGSIRVLGFDPSTRPLGLLQDCYIVPEEFELPPMKLSSYVSLNRVFYPRFSDEVLRANLAAFEFPEDLDLSSLSMGQKKKVLMSFALATNTRLLLMDEPTNGLDVPSKSQFRRVISSQLSDDRCIIISTHQLRDVEMLIDRVVMIDNNRVLLNEGVADICKRLSFEQRPYGSDNLDALYVEASLAGEKVIVRGSGSQDSAIDLELLFTALCEQPDLYERAAIR